MEEQVVQADVLCVGGGIVGVMAAIRASELGAKVVVAEKGNTLHSGKGGAGNDHFLCYIPEIHGPDIEAFIEAIMQTQQGDNFRGMGINRVRAHLEKTFEIVKLWDSWGIPMKYKGKYEFAGHAFPEGLLAMLKYGGERQKIVLTEQALKRGVKIINRVAVFDLLSDDRLIGAIGIGTRENKLVVFKAKSVILGTGSCERLYPSPTPGWFSNIMSPLSLTGDGRVMAYRAGAELSSLEMPRFHSGPKYFARAGQGTWIGVFRDPQGKPIGPWVTKPERKYGDITPEVDKGIFADYAKLGKGPVYMDGSGMSDEDYKYMMYWLVHEGSALRNHLQEEGIDIRKNPVEFMTYHRGSGRVYVSDKGETSVKGLYAAGDEVANGVSNAAVFGWIVGENAANYAGEADFCGIEAVKVKIEEKKRLLEEIRGRRVGPDWREVNIALQQIMHDYAGNVRSEALLKAGLSHLRRVKEKAYTTMIAKNQHELGRCLEVLNLLDLGELTIVAANERRESRGRYVRSDYLLADPRLNNKVLIVKKIGDKPVTEWRKIRQ